jgi:hypothetical protein
MVTRVGALAAAAVLLAAVAVASAPIGAPGPEISLEDVAAELELLGSGTLTFGGGGFNQCFAIGTCPLPTWPPPHGWCGSDTSPHCRCKPCNGQMGCHLA